MSRPSLSAAALLGALVLAAPAGVAAQQLEAPPPLAPLAAPPLPPAFQPPKEGARFPPALRCCRRSPRRSRSSSSRRPASCRARHGRTARAQPGQAGKDVIWIRAGGDRGEHARPWRSDAGRLRDRPRLRRRPHDHRRREARRPAVGRRVQPGPGRILRDAGPRMQGVADWPASCRATSTRPTSRRRRWWRCSCSRRSTCGCGPRC